MTKKAATSDQGWFLPVAGLNLVIAAMPLIYLMVTDPREVDASLRMILLWGAGVALSVAIVLSIVGLSAGGKKK